ncbi:MAG: hypothetical protein GY696_20675 [Gammaproteobacteria bacterium]|nr:hypothetical protein [Gammaproteobacteria bacterium]
MRDCPQRITLVGLQQYIAVLSVNEIKDMIDELVNQVQGTKHQLAIPTVRYVPHVFSYWSQVREINDHIWKSSVCSVFPVMNLHRNFLSRQAGGWVVSAPCYQEFLDKLGLGSTLSAQGMARYVSRLERFHAHGFDVETPLVRPEGDVEPLAIWLTNAYCHDDYCRAVLEGMGYVPTPSVSAAKARRTKVAARRVKGKGKVNTVVPVSRGEGLGITTEPAPAKGVKRPRDAPEIDQNRGKDPSRLPCEYDVIRVTKGTIKDMMNQVAFLKVKLSDAESDRDRHRRQAEA